MIPDTRKYRSLKCALSRLPALGLLLCATAALAAAPAVVVDTQLTVPAGLNTPQSLVVGPDYSIYVADAGNSRILMYPAHSSAGTQVSTAPYTLVNPDALALDSAGDLFIGDSPASGTGRVLEAMATNGTLNGTVNLVTMGGALKDVTALTVDTNPASTTFNTLYIGDDLSTSIYTVAAGSTTLVQLPLVGLPAGLFPTALAKDTAGDLFIADFSSTLYEVLSGSSAVQTYVAPGFVLNSPTGLAFDAKGDLFILTLGIPFTDTTSPAIEEIVEVPGGDATSAFLVPLDGVANGSAVGVDTSGDLYVADFLAGNIDALFYGSAFDLYASPVGVAGSAIQFNYEFNAPLTVGGFKFVSTGDTSTEVVNDGGNCSNGTYDNGNNGSAISPSNPFTCQQNFAAQPAYPGVRNGAVELKNRGGAILNTTQVFSMGSAGASVAYPLTASTGASGINTPEGLAVSGLDKSLYIVNARSALNGGPQILHANGPDGKTLTPVNIGNLLIGSPTGIAINGVGDLYVADTAYGLIDVIPAVAGQAPYIENPGNLLQHPYCLTFDTLGNLYIGDSGPEGSGASEADPGYIVEVPAGGGAPFKLNTGGTTIIYPESLATDPYTTDLYIGDGGNVDETLAKVVKVAAGTGAVTDVTPAGITQPVGIVFDPAEQYYVLDQNAKTITVVPPTGAPYPLPFDNSLLNFPVGLAITNGGQSFVESDVNQSPQVTSNNLVFLNGKLATLAFGSVVRGQQSGTLTATVDNIGNLPLTLQTPYYTSTGNKSPFDILGSTTCAGGVSLNPAATCAINVQFKPTTPASSSERLTLSTDGYNNGQSVIHLTGTGTRATSTVTGK